MKRLIFYIFFITIAGIVFWGGHQSSSLKAKGSSFNDSIASTPWYIGILRDEQISPSAFFYAYNGFKELIQSKALKNDTLLTIIDFEKPSTEERLFIIDVKNGVLVRKSLVAHGKNSGINYATNFSNRIHSNMSSLGLFITSGTYIGKHGYSLRIDGLEDAINSNARKRAVVIHGANYVSQQFIKANGRLGRSFGCPALPLDISKEIIDQIKNGSCLFIYHPSIRLYTKYHS